MTTSINWAKLVKEDRAKAIGVPWSEEEQKALDEGVPPDYVRDGVLSMEEFEEKQEEDEEKSLVGMTTQELMDKADELGIEYEEDSVTRNALMHEISQERS